jgi:hypothetical protein
MTLVRTLVDLPVTHSETMVKRVFKVAEIISRVRRNEAEMARGKENACENCGDHEIGYCQTRDQLSRT